MKNAIKFTTGTCTTETFSRWLAFLLVILLPFSSITQITMLTFEGAKTLEPAQFEIGVMTNPLYVFCCGDTDKFLNRYGTFGRVGVHPNIDLKISYSRMYWEKWKDGMNLIQFGPKFSTNNGRIGFSLPFGIFFEKNEYYSEYGVEKYDTFYGLSPRLILNAVNKRVFELNLNPAGEFLFDKGAEGSVLYGMDIGMGFSSNFDKWSIRPEGGIRFLTYNLEGFYWSIGISGAFRFGSPGKGK